LSCPRAPHRPDAHRSPNGASTSTTSPSLRFVAPPNNVDTGHFVWDWISCSFVDPVAHPSILDLHYDIDHNVTHASIVEPALTTARCALQTPISASFDPFNAAPQPAFATPPSPLLVLSNVAASGRPHLRPLPTRLPRCAPNEFAVVTPPTLALPSSHFQICPIVPMATGRSSRSPSSMRTSQVLTIGTVLPRRPLTDPTAQSWRERQQAKAILWTSQDSTPVCPDLVIGNMQRRGPVPFDFTTSPTTTDYRSDTCVTPIIDADFRHSIDENIKINSNCLASNLNSQNNNYVIYVEKPRVDRIKSDFGIPAAALHGGIRKRSPDRRGLLRLAFHHMLSCRLPSRPSR